MYSSLAWADGMHAGNGVLFNRKRPIRGQTSVTCKITRAVRILLSLQRGPYIGNLHSICRWAWRIRGSHASRDSGPT